MQKEFSLIMATYGRDSEVNDFFETLLKSSYDISKIEVILVDQNDKIDLQKYVLKYEKYVTIKYIKSSEKGLAVNRNIGLKEATGTYVAFPDDDCEYLVDTLYNVRNAFENENIECVMGRIIQKDGTDSLRKWPKKNFKITKGNFYTKCSSITMFYKREKCNVQFNIRIGAGKYYGSCEDTDLLYKNLKANKRVVYNQEITLYHPHYDSKTSMTKEKIASYGLGFGAFVKSNLDVYILMLFLKVEVYHLLKSSYYFLRFNKKDAQNSFIAFKSRIKGFLEYKN